MKINLVWLLAVRFEGGSFNPPNAEEMQKIARDAWAPGWKFSIRSTDRHELSFEVAHLNELMDRIGGIKRAFTSFGITPEVEVDGVSLLEFAWRKQVEAIHRLDLINQTMKELRRPAVNDGNAAIRVALREGLNKSPWEIERELLQGAE